MSKIDPYAALRFKEFNAFLVNQFMLVFARTMQFTIIEWQVYKLTKDPLSLGIIGLMEIIPAFTMALFAGHIVDRREKRNLLALCIGFFFTISSCLFLITWPRITEGWATTAILYAIYVLVFFGGILRAFVGPTIFSFIALIVPRKAYPNAANWSGSTFQVASVLGPALGGFCIHLIGIHKSLSVVFAIVALSLVFLFQISQKPILNPKSDESIIESLKAGVRFVFKTNAIISALSLDMFAVLFGGAVALLPVFAQDILKVGSSGYGILRAAPAVGAFLSMLITTYTPISKNAGMKLLAVVFAFGVSILVFGLSSVFWISVLALFFSGMADGISMVIRKTILQLKTPDHMRGRVAAVHSMFVGSSNELGAFESGVTAKIMGPVASVIFGSTITLLTVIITGWVSPAFRRLDLTKDLEDSKI